MRRGLAIEQNANAAFAIFPNTNGFYFQIFEFIRRISSFLAEAGFQLIRSHWLIMTIATFMKNTLINHYVANLTFLLVDKSAILKNFHFAGFGSLSDSDNIAMYLRDKH